MTTVGIRELKQNASAVIAAAVSGETVTVTDRGRSVAQVVPLAPSPLERLRAGGRLRPAKARIGDLGMPEAGEPLSPVLTELRDDERY